MTDLKQTVTIILKDKDTEMSASYTAEGGIESDDMFWGWFMNVWPMLGLDFVKKGIEE